MYYRVRVDTYQGSKFAIEVLKRLLFNEFGAHIIFCFAVEHPTFGSDEMSLEYVFSSWLSGSKLSERCKTVLGELAVTVELWDLSMDDFHKYLIENC